MVTTLIFLSGCDQVSVVANEVSGTVDGIKNLANTNTVTIRDARHNAEAICVNKVAALHPDRTDIRVKSKNAADYERFDIVVEAYYSQEEQAAAEKDASHHSLGSSVPVTATRFRDDYYCVTDRTIVNLEKFPEMLPK